MTTYNAAAVADAVIAHAKGITLQQGRALRDNPLAIAEGAPGVPANALPTVLLGTLTTTSGSVQTLSGLDLLPYKMLMLFWNGVSQDNPGGFFGVGSASAVMQALAVASHTVSGVAIVELTTGLVIGISATSGADNGVMVGGSLILNASTSVSVTTSGTFDAGQVLVYGCK